MAEFYVESFAGRISRREMHNNENQVFKFENAPYLTEFDENYNPNEDPDFQNKDTDDDSDGGSDLDEDAHEDTRVCFRGKELSLGPCDHKCCEVWRLDPQKPTKMNFSTFRNNIRTMGTNQAPLVDQALHFGACQKPVGLRRGGKALKSTYKMGDKKLMGGKSHGLQKKKMVFYHGFLPKNPHK